MKRRKVDSNNKITSVKNEMKSTNNTDMEVVLERSTFSSEDVRMSSDNDGEYTDQDSSSASPNDGSDLDDPSTVMALEKIKYNESSLFPNFIRLKASELLSEAKPKAIRRSKAAKWCDKVKTILLNSQFSLDISLSEKVRSSVLGLRFPLIQKPERVDGRFKFVKPEKITMVGSFEIGSCVKRDMGIDMVVQIPKEILKKKDYLNERYFRKRALYLCCLANTLKCSDQVDVDDIKFVIIRNMDKPLLMVKPSANSKLKCKLYINAVPEQNTFMIEKFVPNKNNVDFKWYFPRADSSLSVITPTPHYNASIGQDMVIMENDNECKDVLQNNQNVSDALILLKLWMSQKNYNMGLGSIGSFIMSMFVVHLYRKNIINNNMNPLQIVYNVLINFAKTKWNKEGINLSNKGISATDMDIFNSHYDVVMIDVTGTVNLASHVYLHVYLKMLKDAQLTVDFLKSKAHDRFEKVFLMPKLSFMDQFDHILRFNSISLVKSSSKQFSSAQDKMDWRSNHLTRFVKLVTSFLEEGLGHRALLIVPIAHPNEIILSLTEKRPLHSIVSFGIKLNPNHALSIITLGPEANNFEEAAKFRNFWGPKVQLRRFRDGMVKEAMLWSSSDQTLGRKRVIVRDMVQHLLTTKICVDSSHYVYIADQLDSLIYDRFSGAKYSLITTGEELTSVMTEKFDIFAKKVAEVDILPFKIVAIKGNCSLIRGSSLFPSKHTQKVDGSIHLADATDSDEPGSLTSYVVPIEGLMEISINTWPDDISMIPNLIISWLKRLSIKMNEESGLRCYPSSGCIDVVQDDQYVFRLKVYFPAFESVLSKNNSEEIQVFCEDSKLIFMSKSLKFHLDITNSILELKASYYTSYGASCSMAKRWLSSQMIDSTYFPDMLVDLLMASLFTEPFPYEVSMQPQTMFIRFLRLLATHPWGLHPVVVHLDKKVSEEVIKRTEEEMSEQRDKLPSVVIITPYDMDDLKLFKDDPTDVILYFVRNLAIKTYKFMQDVLPMERDITKIKNIFRPALSGYNLLIKLNKLKNPYLKYALHSSSESSRSKSKRPLHKGVNRQDKWILDFNVVKAYLATLRNTYDKKKFLFFYDEYGGDVIGVRINPTVFEPRKMEVSQLQDTEPLGESNVKFNLDTFINNLKIFGEGLVDEVLINNDT